MTPSSPVKRASSFTLRVEALWRQRQGLLPSCSLSVFLTQKTKQDSSLPCGHQMYCWLNAVNIKYEQQTKRRISASSYVGFFVPVLQKTGRGIQMQKWQIRSIDEAQWEWCITKCTFRFKRKFKQEGYCHRLTRTAPALTEQVGYTGLFISPWNI